MAATAVREQPPELSPDGKFFWDGTHWAPMPLATGVPSSPAKRSPNRLAGGLVTAGAVIAVIGCFLPWISASALFVTVTRDGISSPDGEVIAGVAALSALLGAVMLARHVSLAVPFLLFLTAALAMWVVVVDYQDLNGRVNSISSTAGVMAQMGPGIYATGLGVIIWAIGALTALRQPRGLQAG